MIHENLKKIYLILPPKLAKFAKNFYYNEFNKTMWMPRNILVSTLRPFLESGKIDNINILEQKFYSQSGEDGIIKTIFNKIKTTNKFCIEFGIHSDQGNTIYLKKKKWKCLWMDGNGDGKLIKKEFITAENIESIFKKYNAPREPDLLSIDIDSNDYWIWKAIKNYKPRVVVIEYNSSIPPTESKAIKYDTNFKFDKTDYYGGSLLAMQKLGKEKDYTLIACNRIGVNAFFIRNDLIKNNFKIKNIKQIYRPPKYGLRVNGKPIGYPKSKKQMINI